MKKFGGAQFSGSLQVVTGSPHSGTKQFQFSGSGGATGIGDQTGTNDNQAFNLALRTTLGGGLDFVHSGATAGTPTFKEVFKLHTLGDGAIMNSLGPIGENSVLESGSADNIRFEISAVNANKGSFTITLRRGDDTVNRKQILE